MVKKMSDMGELYRSPPMSPQRPTRWRHKKRGTEYEVLGEADLRTGEPLADQAVVAVYRGMQSGRLCVRPVRERSGMGDELLGEAGLQTETPLTGYAVVVVYRDVQSSRLWVRPVSEFNDGRFERLR